MYRREVSSAHSSSRETPVLAQKRLLDFSRSLNNLGNRLKPVHTTFQGHSNHFPNPLAPLVSASLQPPPILSRSPNDLENHFQDHPARSSLHLCNLLHDLLNFLGDSLVAPCKSSNAVFQDHSFVVVLGKSDLGNSLREDFKLPPSDHFHLPDLFMLGEEAVLVILVANLVSYHCFRNSFTFLVVLSGEHLVAIQLASQSDKLLYDLSSDLILHQTDHFFVFPNRESLERCFLVIGSVVHGLTSFAMSAKKSSFPISYNKLSVSVKHSCKSFHFFLAYS